MVAENTDEREMWRELGRPRRLSESKGERRSYSELLEWLETRQSERLQEFSERLSDTSRECIARHGLPISYLYAMHLRYNAEANPHSFVLHGYQKDSKKIEKFATSLRNAAYGLRFVANLKLPYDGAKFSEDPYSGHDRPVDDLTPTVDGVVHGGALLPMKDESRGAFASRIVRVFNLPFSVAETNGAEWRSPFRVPRWFLARVPASAWAEMSDEQRASWPVNRDASCTALDLDDIAALLDDFADQFFSVAVALRSPKGRPVAKIERAFRDEFAAFAQRHAGQFLDEVGADLFSKTFHSMTADVYMRSRQKDNIRPPRRKSAKRT